jgi:hypothetical protein
MSALVVRAGVIERIALDKQADESIHALIGDTFSSCFQVIGSGAGRRIIGYCADDYTRNGLPWNVQLDTNLYRGGWPIAGPVVITAAILPDTVGMTELEMSAFHILPRHRFTFKGQEGVAPILTFRPGFGQ